MVGGQRPANQRLGAGGGVHILRHQLPLGFPPAVGTEGLLPGQGCAQHSLERQVVGAGGGGRGMGRWLRRTRIQAPGQVAGCILISTQGLRPGLVLKGNTAGSLARWPFSGFVTNRKPWWNIPLKEVAAPSARSKVSAAICDLAAVPEGCLAWALGMAAPVPLHPNALPCLPSWSLFGGLCRFSRRKESFLFPEKPQR